MNHFIKIYIGAAIITLGCIAGCKKEHTLSHDPAKPIVIEKFTPQSGGANTEVLLYGSNFSTDTAEIEVRINGIKARVIGAIVDRILFEVPKKAGNGKIEVSIQSAKGTSEDEFAYTPTSVVTTFAGSGQAAFADGSGAEASFNFGRRSGLDIDGEGNLYIADSDNFRVRKISPDGEVTTLAGSAYGYLEGKGSEAQFFMPFDIAVDNSGDLYVTDPAAWTVRKITPDGTTSLVVWGEAWGIGLDKRNGNLYYTNNGNPGSIFRITPDQNVEEIITGLGNPADVAVDREGDLYVTLAGTSEVKKFKAETWEVMNTAGQAGNPGLVNGPAAQAKFDAPWGIAFDPQGNLLIAGNGSADGSATNTNQCIRRINTADWVVSTFAGGSIAGFADGTGSQALFHAPTGVVADQEGNVFVLDSKNNRIRKVVVE